MILEDVVREVIKEKVSKQQAFTAFDITMQAKKRGANSSHIEVKYLVHMIMEADYSDVYQKELIDIPGNSTRPFLYFPEFYDVKEYIPMDSGDFFEPVFVQTVKPICPYIEEDDDIEDWYDEDEDESPLW